MLECNYVIKMVESDHYENGCTGKVSDCSYQYKIQGESLDDILKKITEHTNCLKADIMVGEFETNRIDVTVMETGDCNAPSSKDMLEWKAGNIELYVVDYSFYFDEVSKTPANFK